MSYGFFATNENGQVLISSQTRNLHFVGKATMSKIINQTNGYGGIRHYSFTIAITAQPIPFFSVPTGDFYGIPAVRAVSPGLWEIEVIQSGINTVQPEVYVFVDPRGISGAPPTDYGMKIWMDDGTPAFDSRYSPLVVTGGLNIYPPSNPRVAGPLGLSAQYCQSFAGDTFKPDNANTFNIAAPPGKPIVCFPSLAQAERQYGYSASEQHCTGFSAYGNCIGWSTRQTWNSTYWAFYRSGMSLVGGTVKCGWIVTNWGCYYDYQGNGAFLGIGIGGSSGNGGGWPYSNETLNLMPTGVIISDGLLYD